MSAARHKPPAAQPPAFNFVLTAPGPMGLRYSVNQPEFRYQWIIQIQIHCASTREPVCSTGYLGALRAKVHLTVAEITHVC
jgi:hypothetical protein